MRNFILLAVAMITLYSCSKSSSSSVVVPANAHWIPLWKNTRLIAAVDSGNLGVISGDPNDTIYTNTIGDTSIVIYKGQKIYLWWQPKYSTDVWHDSANTYINCYLGPIPFDSTTAYGICSVTPSKFLHNGALLNNSQGIFMIYNSFIPFNLHLAPPMGYNEM